MKKITLLIVAIILASIFVSATPIGNVIVVGANGIPDNTAYLTLKEAFDAINGQPDQNLKDIEIQITASTTETATAALNQPTTASWNSLTIYPTVENVSISGNFLSVLIDLNGADKVTINGKLNKTGSSKSLSIIQLGNGDNAARTIRLWNDAKLNTITHCIIKGSCPSSGAGVLFIGTGLATTGTGNDENTISYNDFNKAGTVSPYSSIYSAGTSGMVNDKNVIEYNNFFNLYGGGTSYAIRVGSNSSEFTIRNNNIYEPNDVTPAAANAFYGISITGTGEKFMITNNYIGGSGPGCTGLFRKSNAFSNDFNGVFISTATGATNATSIQGNVIKNIEWKNAAVKKDFVGFNSFGSMVSIGTTEANTISNITWENGAISGGVFYGFNVINSEGLHTLQNNVIADITINNTDATHGSNFYGIFKSNSAGSVTIQNNIIRDISGLSTSTSNSQILAGIHCNYTSSTIRTYNFDIIGNTIYNINNASSRTDVGNSVYGIFVNPPQGSGNITKNKIYGITASATSLPARVIGINMDVTSTSIATICSNNMISLGNSNPGLVYGILQNTGLSKVLHNTVYLAGSPAIGSFESSSINVTGTTTGREIFNNILYNTRTNSGTASDKHYALKINSPTGLSSDNNLLYVNGIGGLVGLNAAIDCPDLAAWKTSTSLDASSKSKSVEFSSLTDLSITGTSVNDAELGAPLLGTVSTDILTTSRATTTYMGAHEASNLTTPAPTKAFTVTVPNGTAKVYVAGTFTGKKWDITSPHELTATANPNEFTGTFACANDVAYKYLCEKNDWDYQEAAYNGSNPPVTGSNRTYNSSDVVPIWYRVKSVKLNVSFATSAVPTQLFVKGGWDSWSTPIELTKSGSTFSTTISGVLSDKIPADTQYKFYTNDMNTDNWEANADGSLKDNRWSIAPVMNDEIARFTTQIVTKLDNATNNARIIRTVSGIEVQLNGLSTIELLNVNGVLIDKTISNSTYSHKLDNGIYILKINGLATKFIK